MGRPPKPEPTQIAIPASTYARLQYLAKLGMHGDSAPEVARFLIGEGLTRLWREGKIPDNQD